MDFKTWYLTLSAEYRLRAAEWNLIKKADLEPTGNNGYGTKKLHNFNYI